MIHSKHFSKLVVTAAFALGAFVAGCALEGGEPTESVGNQSSPVTVGQAPNKVPDVVGAPANNVVPQQVTLSPVLHQDHTLGSGGGGLDEGPRPHPWAPGPDDDTSDTTTNSGTTSDNKSSK